MATYAHVIDGTRHVFDDLRTLLACATPERSGDRLAGVGAGSAVQRAAAQMALADVPLGAFLQEALVPYEADEVTRLIVDSHDAAAFAPIAHLTVGSFREWLLSDDVDSDVLARVAPGITPEMAAAVAKIMRAQDLVLAARKARVVTRFRNTIGLAGRMATRLQPNHPTDDLAGIAASVLDGLLYGSGDAVIGINPALDNVAHVVRLLEMLDAVITRYEVPTQACVLTHVTSTLRAIERGAPVDLVFQSIGGTQGTNASFGVSLSLLAEARDAALSLHRGATFAEGPGQNVMYFETGQGSALSAGAHHGCDQQTLEARAYGVARHFAPPRELGGRLHRARIPLRRQADHARWARGSLLRQAAGPADGRGHLLHEPRRGGSGRHGCPAHRPWRCGLHLHHGRARCRRCDAELPEHVVPRCAVRAARPRLAAGAGVRGVARADGHLRARKRGASAGARRRAAPGLRARIAPRTPVSQ